jgi:hypothetical protein
MIAARASLSGAPRCDHLRPATDHKPEGSAMASRASASLAERH